VASIEKKLTKAGAARYRVRLWDGPRRYERWFPKLELARAWKTRVEGDTLDGVLRDPRSGAVTLNAYFDRWLPRRLVKGRPLSPTTRYTYGRLWRRNVRDDLGGQQLRAIRTETVRRWHERLITTVGQSQAAKSYTLLRAVLATAEADDLIRQNPCKIRGAGQENPAERPLPETSLVLDLADSIDPRYRAMVLLAGFGGLSTGESLGLRRRDVDLLHHEVSIEVQAQHVIGVGRALLPPKSEAGRRVVVLPSVVLDALERHLDAYTPTGANSPVFTAPGGGPAYSRGFSEAWLAAKKAAGAPNELRPHDLRHHAATVTARTPGITTKELMARIGHSTPRAALIYQHATRERDQAVAAFLDNVVAAVERPRAPVLSIVEDSSGGLAGG
jgi:integrase